MKIRTVTAAFIAAGLGLGVAFSAAQGAHAAPARHSRAAAAPAFPKGTGIYYTYDQGYGAVVATSGVNVSKTASFTVSTHPYWGTTFAPVRNDSRAADNTSAFANYLGQAGEWVYGPGNAWTPPGYPTPAVPANTAHLKLVWSGENVYTNGVKAYVYEGTGLDKSEAGNIADLLSHGTFLQP